MSITVAVRVRPFNEREINMKSKLCVKMKDNTTILTSDEGKVRSFTFDYSFWSHSGYKEDENGLLIKKNKKYADQQMIFDLFGKQVLENAFMGYHCCLFAYGQTDSGKSYSMIGYGANKGIVPMTFNRIFEMTRAEKSKSKQFEVAVSMMEIYNEKIQDLLLPIKNRPKGGLKIRESKQLGVYVQGLSKQYVQNYEEIEAVMELGNTNRTIASTQMNTSSSRAHTIIQLQFKQIKKIKGVKTEKFSMINLVDLAGSERAKKSGAVGDRLKEGSSINKSLTTLGLVISILAEQAMGKSKKKIIPYRNSSLTRILQNALGGNSKTFMICAISPSNNNFDETLSTLRYADQAKKIKCHAKVNESQRDKKVRLLEEENLKLKKKLEKIKINYVNIKDDEQNLGKASELSKYKEKIQDMEENMKATQMILEEYQKSYEQKTGSKKLVIQKNNYDHPHIVNKNEDPSLDEKIFYDLHQIDNFYIGRPNGQPKPHIILQSIGIQANHAVITRSENSFFLALGD